MNADCFNRVFNRPITVYQFQAWHAFWEGAIPKFAHDCMVYSCKYNAKQKHLGCEAAIKWLYICMYL